MITIVPTARVAGVPARPLRTRPEQGLDYALDGPLPTRDRYEPNDDAGSHAFRLSGTNRRVNATLDFWDDQDDIYGVPLHKGQRVFVGMTGTNPDVDLSLALWLPETRSVQDVHHLRLRVRVSARPGSRQYLSYRAPKAGTYFLQVRISSEGSSAYRLSIAKGR